MGQKYPCHDEQFEVWLSFFGHKSFHYVNIEKSDALGIKGSSESKIVQINPRRSVLFTYEFINVNNSLASLLW